MIRRISLFQLLFAAALVVTLGCPKPDPVPDCAADGDCAIGSICEQGVCEAAPCPETYDPNCGEDGKTYGNACEARAAHVAVAHPGECQRVCGGLAGLPCPEGDLCDLQAGMCGANDLDGVCIEQPLDCPEVFEPVCACDGETYSNDCFRKMAGVQKDHDGECLAGQ